MSQIIALTGIDSHEVHQIVRDENIAKLAAKKNFEERLPLIKEIVGLGLEQINRVFKDMSTDEVYRAVMITSAKDLTAITKVISDLNTLLRLDQGQSTEHVLTHTYQETRTILEDFRKRDVVFDLPALPEETKIKKLPGED